LSAVLNGLSADLDGSRLLVWLFPETSKMAARLEDKAIWEDGEVIYQFSSSKFVTSTM
jgi:hypothetical protein